MDSHSRGVLVMVVTAALVKELRERTGAGMMECKKALEATHGDLELAIEELRKSGRAKADKKAGRVAAEGIVVVQTSTDGKHAVMLEVNSETDFVARDENFLAFVAAVAKTALAAKVATIEALSTLILEGSELTVEDARKTLVAKVGENIHVRRIALINTPANNVGTYTHGNRIGVLVEVEGGNQELAKDVAMHIAACKPLVISQTDVPADLIAKEKEIYLAQAASSGKPQEILEKMVAGKLKKYLDEVSLMGQPFVKDPETLVANLLGKNKAKVVSFTRFEVGEGIEKETEDFVEAVMSQIQAS
jgi:elongation factor Ts